MPSSELPLTKNSAKLNVYSASWCPHCRRTVDYLRRNNISFNEIGIGDVAGEPLKKLIEVNGGRDWVIPTLEFNGQWRRGQLFDEKRLTKDLKKMGVIR